jgi:hypothetical protein
LGIGVEFADQGVSIFVCCLCELRDEGFNQIPAGLFEGFGAAEVCGIGLHECGVEIELSNQKAELVPQSWLAVTRTVSVARKRRGQLGMRRWRRRREGSKLFDRAQADTISFPESAIDGAGFGNSHLSPTDKRRHVRRINVAVADKSLRTSSFVYRRLEYPSDGLGVAVFTNWLNSDTRATIPISQSQ